VQNAQDLNTLDVCKFHLFAKKWYIKNYLLQALLTNFLLN